ncbi:phasin family protein [Fonticella tunisiensis]|uniref:Polyhydroxyalkanoate synthesis regulator phasin n=1 Tax=Fonticella tunisiensis TaxID=1096341 RepID=A0A4V3ETY3_9CLOT|nr:hypothetical protein [Fonticella tunisiensis]TDT63355.1 polyhydroxyalkanoate synthesis regulator phasin [Fonticella tunisiensis]
MIEDFKKIIFLGLGSAAYTYEKISDIIENLVKKGQLTVDEAKDLSEELKRNIKEKDESTKPLSKKDADIMNFVTRDELEEIKVKLLELENKINNK